MSNSIDKTATPTRAAAERARIRVAVEAAIKESEDEPSWDVRHGVAAYLDNVLKAIEGGE